MKTITESCLILTGSFLLALRAQAQTYSIDWYTVAGGGGTSTGTTYSVSSTIGQHEAGRSMTGGGYALTGGFWALYAVPTPGAPLLSILLSDTNTVLISWQASATTWTLQQNTSLVSGSWLSLSNTVNIVNGQNQVVLPAPFGNRFYRLQNP